MVPLNDPTHIFSCECSYLDFVLIVGSRLGLDLFMPNVTVDYSFKATFDFKHRIKEFHAKYGKLGFNPSGAMWWIGELPSSESMWIGMAPKSFLSGADDSFCMTEAHGDTRLNTKHYGMMVTFMANCLSQIPGLHYYCLEPYPDLDDGSLKDNTNIILCVFLSLSR